VEASESPFSYRGLLRSPSSWKGDFFGNQRRQGNGLDLPGEFIDNVSDYKGG